ncbi:Gfo/Idh/MocA family oxidoreductase [Paenibacillus sp. SC116]|uniref:Gfo/Idh/MocA family protein n=1 Tax=Paenibacillus sp. SC116 TaxID=2968986 RepID=UPI00215B430E|nr:Gfo/Idh/MocA family oxidoreductase [Paenibacillus sp. SC116]MCR8842193.1 Gfo/Idh/MocA family oxidoreductase [Paenibacillus sp. SC116]
MKIGVIGIGDIAKKAYLPILGTRADVELSIASRNQEVVTQVAQQYRVAHQCASVQELIATKIEAAFVHAATEAHPIIVRELIEAGVHVFVDKPIAYTLRETEEIVSLAGRRGVGIMVGFNRRFAPMYRNLKTEIHHPETILLQKNRTGPLSDIRTTILDDYIHVVDTLLAYVGDSKLDINVQAKIEEDLLHYVILNVASESTTAIGMMHRQTGVTEERLEIMGNQKKFVINNMVHTTAFVNQTEQHQPFGDWTTTLYRRGFVDMIDHFITCVRNGQEFETSGERSLRTHELCEKIVLDLS